jgi:hypothetical protein
MLIKSLERNAFFFEKLNEYRRIYAEQLGGDVDIKGWRAGSAGDVIMCPGFANGTHFLEKPGHGPELAEAIHVSDGPCRHNGDIFDAWDESRINARFVVEEFGREAEDYITWEELRKSPCGCENALHWEKFNDICWYVRARRLRADGSYEPEGELISFLLIGMSWEAHEDHSNLHLLRNRIILKSPIFKVGSMVRSVRFS